MCLGVGQVEPSGGAQCLVSAFWEVGIEYAVCRLVVGSGWGLELLGNSLLCATLG